MARIESIHKVTYWALGFNLHQTNVRKFTLVFFVVSTGDKWRSHRKMLTPAFHFRILESFVPIINKQQRVMLKIFEDQMDNNCVIDDVKPLIVNCGLDILCGKKIDF